MIIFTDNIYFARNFLQKEPFWEKCRFSDLNETIRLLVFELFSIKQVFVGEIRTEAMWQYLFLVDHAPKSQYDILIDLSRQDGNLPNGILCVAGSGKEFHGFKNRTWESRPGNLHLSVFFRPDRKIKTFGAGFMVLAAVSVINTLDALPELVNQSFIKWVNDILIGRSKVCGVLAHTQNQGEKITGAILGIGLNVKSKPQLSPTRFVPEAAALCEFMRNKQQCSLEMAFSRLIYFLEINYKKLISGKYPDLLETYRSRSIILNKNVEVWSDSENEELIARGKVQSIGDNLELTISGMDTPVTKGRLALPEPNR